MSGTLDAITNLIHSPPGQLAADGAGRDRAFGRQRRFGDADGPPGRCGAILSLLCTRVGLFWAAYRLTPRPGARIAYDGRTPDRQRFPQIAVVNCVTNSGNRSTFSYSSSGMPGGKDDQLRGVEDSV